MINCSARVQALSMKMIFKRRVELAMMSVNHFHFNVTDDDGNNNLLVSSGWAHLFLPLSYICLDQTKNVVSEFAGSDGMSNVATQISNSNLSANPVSHANLVSHVNHANHVSHAGHDHADRANDGFWRLNEIMGCSVVY